MARVTASPRPVPSPTSLVVKKGSKIRAWISVAMPTPVSAMVNCSEPLVLPAGDIECAACGHGLDGVEDEVHHYLFDRLAVDAAKRVAAEIEIDDNAFEPVPQEFEAIEDDRVDMDLVAQQGLDPAVVEQLPHGQLDPPEPLAQQGQVPFLQVLVLRLLLHGLDTVEHPRQRVVDLMGDRFWRWEV